MAVCDYVNGFESTELIVFARCGQMGGRSLRERDF